MRKYSLYLADIRDKNYSKGSMTSYEAKLPIAALSSASFNAVLS